MKVFLRKNWLVLIGVFIVWIIFSLVIFFLSNDFKLSVPILNELSLTNFGMFGDSFNILTSLFTGFAFAGVIISIRLQKEELKEVKKEFEEQTKALEKQQKEMAIQSFDNKFFQMLNLFNNIIDSFREKEVTRNRTTIDYSGDKMRFHYPEERNIIEHEKREVLVRIKNILEKANFQTREDFQTKFNGLNQQYDTTFKFYFINLYQVLKYIDMHLKDIKEAKNYTNIVRAQLSKDELVLLFYNAIGVIPFSEKKYKVLVEKYAFFEHLTYEDLTKNSNNKKVIDILLKEYDLDAFGRNEDLKSIVSSL